ncbi:hypothetical protein BKA62DRAFT_768519 [Auriculariales sp. MPI-PUGE-AT-0066]|nr:hypothetical protein BKA62DRAFT_768519 [Auriculariales sp. MPI-PUGE-AT-0066]
MSTATTANDWSNYKAVHIALVPSLYHSGINRHVITDKQVIKAMIEESVKIGRCVRAADALECSHWAKRSNVIPYARKNRCPGNNLHCPDASCRLGGFITVIGLKKHLDPRSRHKACPANKHMIMRHLDGPCKDCQQEDVVNLSKRANELTPMQDLTNSVSPSRLAISDVPVTKSPKKLPTPMYSHVENHERGGHADGSAQAIRPGLTRTGTSDTAVEQKKEVDSGKWSVFDPDRWTASFEIDNAASREGPMLQLLIAVTLAEAGADDSSSIHPPIVTATENATSTSFKSPPAFAASSNGKETLVSSQG